MTRPRFVYRTGFARQRAIEINEVSSITTTIAKPNRVNQQIRVREVRVIDEEGNQLGILPIQEALRVAYEHNLDLGPDVNMPQWDGKAPDYALAVDALLETG